ncbi:phage tail protein [Marinomonas balearica]|uniref:Uncharacterized protein n=1 Tax=Marinomonas balearica TaxID=491947 RepID=A0A4R6M7Q8_9GAMM|nr:phage tail protein [Marinomonas balearica]TDO97451.1 hypothetical protein DFP79_2270 [Marinomonas balearica]
MSVNNEIARLTQAVQDHTNETQSFLDKADGRVTEKENQVEQFLASATPEKRFVQKITVGGSSEYLYPVFWRFPSNDFGIGRLEISRHYSWNRGTLHDSHVASLLLSIEGNAYPWSGDTNYMRVKKAHYRYNETASHLQFGGYASRVSTDGNAPTYGSDGTNYLFSGVYLRGGGLDYVLSSNWEFTPLRLDDESDVNSTRVLHTYQNVAFTVSPIPMAEIKAPVETE